ncbi:MULTISPECIES: YbdK family carboxylate-amine ligase [Caballeronia]|jgi:carboxylate-amine ligase|uniref:Putative glutamate--cysteine ligase 2 n=1 Tax=Caballeronia zhejiangensis TaxID=871203 RepID=A0A656QH02_9BURK|nr:MULTISPECIES: YbdK family carboxylate-amine ligase [Caballeronia]EKS69197.1 gamma-glutamyl:cysteine ligase [Burkholderia sp. SJ98]KDR29214.1 gamma-glutamyl ligase [Caballeronia zhejiangensis]MCG7399779.1 YbdK family carboxylate-amine ligase [Caballeronia zhejiangensis]MCI1041668.1 glutamate--cysteine ligase [Caballeronia zhejiangensis]MDR5763733.1 YbdK family carboxylate-amine ligase [Caballeronia sp. LZ028]
MALEPFINSEPFTFGVELEIQVVNTHDYDLTRAASDLMRLIKDEKIPGNITPEITESMIELSTGICTTHEQAVTDLRKIRDVLVAAADQLNVGLAGGGTHAFQQWSDRQIYDAPRFQYISELYGYLAKQFTVFGQHVHIGCPDPNSALFLLHAMSRYIPHFIALSASSPYIQGVDTGFHSARLNSVFAFPLSGRAPFVLTWDGFEEYFSKMVNTGVVNSMKDFYWDIRPKPGFGTIEVRVMDTPLSVDRAAAIACYIQTLSRYLLLDKPLTPREDDYLVYTFNRFEACRFGLEGTCIHPQTGERQTIGEDILATLDVLAPHAEALGSQAALAEVADIARGVNDATWLRGVVDKEKSLHEAVRQQCLQWRR